LTGQGLFELSPLIRRCKAPRLVKALTKEVLMERQSLFRLKVLPQDLAASSRSAIDGIFRLLRSSTTVGFNNVRDDEA
jgi:hypothetical protein